MERSYKIFISFIFFIIPFFTTINALAEQKATETIHIKTEAGFDGRMLDGRGFPLKITIENKGDAFKGDLLIPFSPTYEIGGNTLLSVDIPEKSSKTYLISHPGISSDSNYQMKQMKLYKGSFEDGDQIRFSGTKEIRGNIITQYTLGILTDQFDQLKDLRNLPSDLIYTTRVTKENITENQLGLDSITFLLVDEYALSNLSEGQQKAIKGWIQQGGVLITSAVKKEEQAFGILSNSMPMTVDMEELIPLSVLEKEQGETTGNVEGFSAKLNENASAIKIHNDSPVIGIKKLGNGAIIETAFSISDNTLIKWTGYSKWLEGILLENATQVISNPQYGSMPLNSIYYGFVSANEFFKGANFSIQTLFWILIIYFILIVPVLYFILKKYDKREYAWWIIPSVSILLSFGMFIVGAKDRIGSAQLNEMGVYQYNNHHLTGYQATTLLSNKSGEYRLSYPKSNYIPLPYIGYAEQSTDAVLREKANRNEVIYKDVEYWSNRTMYGKSTINVEGGFEHELEATDTKLEGTITNTFPYSFEKVFIWSGHEKLQVGSLKSGETKQINLTRSSTYFTSPNGFNPAYNAYDYIGNNLTEMRENVLESTIINLELWEKPIGYPVIVGITSEDIVDVKLEGGKLKKNSTNLVMEELPLSNTFPGQITFENNELEQRLESVSGLIYDDNFQMNEVNLEDGQYYYHLQIPVAFKHNSFRIDSLSITNAGMQGVNISILNHETGKYEEIKNTFSADKEKVSAYINQMNVQVKIDKQTNGDPYVELPRVKLKGEITE